MSKEFEKKKKKKGKKLKLWVKAVGIVVICAMGFFVFNTAYRNKYKDRFYPKTYISAKDISGLSIADTENLLKKRYKTSDVVLTLDNHAVARTKLSSVSDYNPEVQLRNALNRQEKYNLYQAMFSRKNFNDSDLEYNREKIQNWIKSVKVLNDTSDKSKDAYVRFDKDINKYVIVKEHIGSIYKTDKIVDYIYSSLKKGEKRINIKKSDFVVAPKVLSINKDLKDETKSLNRLAGHKITLKDQKGTTVVLDSDRYMKYLSYKNGRVSVNKNWLYNYASSLRSNFGAYGNSISFKTPDGRNISVSGGTYRKTISVLSEYHQLEKDILSGRNIERNIKITTTGNDTLGKTFILINKSAQTIEGWKNGKKIISDRVVTGDETKGYGTTRGAYYIFSKESPKVLKGYDKETGEQLYASPVTYWMPFHNGQGIHDATWRSNWSKSAYISGGGSHGCCNAKRATAARAFSAYSVGTPVIVI